MKFLLRDIFLLGIDRGYLNLIVFNDDWFGLDLR